MILFVSVSIVVRTLLHNIQVFWQAIESVSGKTAISVLTVYYLTEIHASLIQRTLHLGSDLTWRFIYATFCFMDAYTFGALVENFQKGLTNRSEGVCEEAITQVVCVLKWKARGMQGQWENNTKQAGRLTPCWAPGEWASSPAMQRNHQTSSIENLNRVPLPRSPTQPVLHGYATRELSPSIMRLFQKERRRQRGRGDFSVKKHIFRLWKDFESVLVTMYNYRFSFIIIVCLSQI